MRVIMHLAPHLTSSCWTSSTANTRNSDLLSFFVVIWYNWSVGLGN